MRISVFGLGYVGCVSAACLAGMGHEVIGVDVNQVKVDLVNDAKAPVVRSGSASSSPRSWERGITRHRRRP
ncbi:hypothetical protein GCM10017687_60490 [Streptomyces echinatus]